MNGLIRYDDISDFDASDDELRAERDALLTRVRILEASLACIERESDVPQHRPELSFMAVQRIGSVARQALERDHTPLPKSARRPITRVRS